MKPIRILIAFVLLFLACLPAWSAARRKYTAQRRHARSHATYKPGRHVKSAKQHTVRHKVARHRSAVRKGHKARSRY